jgi:hypothetical protein
MVAELGRTEMSQPPPTPGKFNVQRLFIGVWSTGIGYYDKTQEDNGQYKRVAFLDYHTLELQWHGSVPPELAGEIIADAATIQAQRARPFQFAGRGQTVILGE